MNLETWVAVDNYFVEQLIPSDPILDYVLMTSDKAGLPPISVTPLQGKLLHSLALINGAKKILEIGTLGGYSTIWLARALPDGGKIITLEASEQHAKVAQSNFNYAGLNNKIELRVGMALDILPLLEQEKIAPFDLIFIDADKQNNPFYLEWAIKLARSGTVIIIDNVVRNGMVLNASQSAHGIQGIRKCIEDIAINSSLTATAIQTVGAKGYDGFILAVVNSTLQEF